MSFTISETETLLKKHDRELVNFYPYAGDDDFFIPCLMIVKPYNFNNHKDIKNINIKLYSASPITSLNVDLENINKIIFINGEGLLLSAYNVVPFLNDLFQNQKKESSISEKGIVQKSVVQYANFDFDILSPGIVVSVDTVPAYQYLSAYYRFEGNGLDSFGDNDLIASGTPTFTEGKANLGVKGGEIPAGYYRRSIPVQNLDKFSFTCWVQASVESIDIKKIGLYAGSTAKITVASRNFLTQDPFFNGARYPLNAKVHIALTYNKAGVVNYYINSVLAKSYTTQSFNLTDIRIELVGGLFGQQPEDFTDELAFYSNYILTQTNIDDSYNSGAGVFL